MKTVENQIRDYLRYCKYNRDMRDSTLKTKYYHIIKFARDVGARDLRKLDNEIIDRWREVSRSEGMAKKTINGYIDDVTLCVKYLRDKRQQKVSLMPEAIDRYRIRYDNEDLPSFTPEEIAEIKRHCRGLLEELAFSLTFETAMRLHEVTYLRLEDIREVNGRQYFRITGKGGKRRNTFMLPETQAMLKRWLMLAGIHEGWVFPSPVREGLPYTNDQMRTIISRPIRRARFKEGGPQSIRRSSISIALDNGMPLAKVSKWVGHTDSRVTLKHYYKPDIERMQNDHLVALRNAFEN